MAVNANMRGPLYSYWLGLWTVILRPISFGARDDLRAVLAFREDLASPTIGAELLEVFDERRG